MSIGALTAGAGAVAVSLLALRTYSQQGLTISGVVLPLAGAVALGAGAFFLRRLAPVGASIALTSWILLGLIPSEIPLWLGFAELLLLVCAGRGAFVLRQLTKTN
jgi:hypothetical protein